MPEIESEINASAVEHLAKFGEDMRKVREDEDRRSREIVASCSVDGRTLDRRKLRGFGHDGAGLAVREIGRRLGLVTLSRRRCDELARLICGGEAFVFQWQGKFTVSGHDGKIYFVEGE